MGAYKKMVNEFGAAIILFVTMPETQKIEQPIT